MVLLSIHVLGDFYFQTEVIAQKKKEKLEWVLLHSVIYAVVSGVIVLSGTIKMLLLHKPANIFISNVLEQYKPQEHKCDTIKDKNAGRFVGTLERIIMTIFITMGQYSVVGLVLTAKSITRYNRISEDPEFAEYYLLGTLLSTICAICISILF